MTAHTVAVVVPALVVALLIVLPLLSRRRGYNPGGNTVVRCRQGHVFTTIWLPGASLKAVRLGRKRLQWCPVGKHWTLVAPVKDADLTLDERMSAARYRDSRIP